MLYVFVIVIMCLTHTGHGGSRAAEYLKEHLFENLMKHPHFLTDTKLAFSALKISALFFCTAYCEVTGFYDCIISFDLMPDTIGM